MVKAATTLGTLGELEESALQAWCWHASCHGPGHLSRLPEPGHHRPGDRHHHHHDRHSNQLDHRHLSGLPRPLQHLLRQEEPPSFAASAADASAPALLLSSAPALLSSASALRASAPEPLMPWPLRSLKTSLIFSTDRLTVTGSAGSGVCACACVCKCSDSFTMPVTVNRTDWH